MDSVGDADGDVQPGGTSAAGPAILFPLERAACRPSPRISRGRIRLKMIHRSIVEPRDCGRLYGTVSADHRLIYQTVDWFWNGSHAPSLGVPAGETACIQPGRYSGRVEAPPVRSPKKPHDCAGVYRRSLVVSRIQPRPRTARCRTVSHRRPSEHPDAVESASSLQRTRRRSHIAPLQKIRASTPVRSPTYRRVHSGILRKSVSLYVEPVIDADLVRKTGECGQIVQTGIHGGTGHKRPNS